MRKHKVRSKAGKTKFASNNSFASRLFAEEEGMPSTRNGVILNGLSN